MWGRAGDKRTEASGGQTWTGPADALRSAVSLQNIREAIHRGSQS